MNPEKKGSVSTLLGRIDSLLDEKMIEYRVIEHQPLDGSAANSALISGTRPEQGAKALIMLVNEEEPIMVVLRGPDRANIKKLKETVGSKNIRFAKLKEVQAVTHTEIGTLPAIGSLFNIPTYVDKNLLEEAEIAFGTGLRTKTILINTRDYIKATSPNIGDFADTNQ